MEKIKLNAKQLRTGETKKVETHKQDIYLILDSVYDTYNVGSCFRLADAIAAKEILLCQGTPIPPNHRIKKSSINTTEWVDWSYFEKTIDAINDLRSQVPNIQIISVEQFDRSIPYDKFEYKLPIALIVGNETTGVSQEVLKASDAVVELPMFGVNVSLNVMVSLSIVAYQVIEKVLK